MRNLTQTLAALLFVGSMAMVGSAFAQDEPDPAAERADSFQAASGAQTENVPGGTLMIAAYGAVFVLIFGYVASLAVRQNNTQRELDRLRQDLEAHGGEDRSESA